MKSDQVLHLFTWSFGGDQVFLIGSFNLWKERIQMEKVGNEFKYEKLLDRGMHYYKFIVDNEWRFAPDQQTTHDNHGNINNVVDTSNYASYRESTYDR